MSSLTLVSVSELDLDRLGELTDMEDCILNLQKAGSVY